jgi:hypothetical protein
MGWLWEFGSHVHSMPTFTLGLDSQISPSSHPWARQGFLEWPMFLILINAK